MSKPYADYTISISDTTSRDSVRYEQAGPGGRLVRFTHLLYRIPSRKEFVVQMFHDATDQDRHFVERTLSGHGALFDRNSEKARRERRPDGTYAYSIMAGRVVDDPMVQLELEMMIDLSSGVNA